MPTLDKRNGKALADIVKFTSKDKADVVKVDGITLVAGPSHIPLWVGVGRDGQVMYSSDALTWTEYYSPAGATNDYWDISFGKDDSGGPRWIISTDRSPELRYSDDPTAGASSWSWIDFPGASDISRTVEYSATGTWIAGTSEGVVYRSTDGGDSWTEITGVAAGSHRCLATDGTGTWLVGGASKVFKSYDDGLNWYLSSAAVGKANGIEYNNGVWFLASDSTTSYRATTIAESDTTDTWTAVTGISVPLWAICHIDGDTWMTAIKGRQPYLSTDNCASWSATTGRPGPGQVMALASDGTTVVLGNKNNKIYTSTDNGGTWTLRHTSGEDVLVIEYNKVKPF